LKSSLNLEDPDIHHFNIEISIENDLMDCTSEHELYRLLMAVDTTNSTGSPDQTLNSNLKGILYLKRKETGEGP